MPKAASMHELSHSPMSVAEDYVLFRESPEASANLETDVDKDTSFRARHQMEDLKAKLLLQQDQLKMALRALAEQAKRNVQIIEPMQQPGAGQVEHDSILEDVRRCPMCEATFSDDISQEDFEAHVVEHFNYEEGETLRHYDFVNDASDMTRFV